MTFYYSLMKFLRRGINPFESDWDNCYSVLRETLIKYEDNSIRHKQLFNDLKQWKRSGSSSKMEEFPNLYLNIRAHLKRQSKLPELFSESLDEKIQAVLGKHAVQESINLLFLDESDQKITLGKQFILNILKEAKGILGSTANNLLPKSIEFCESIPQPNFELVEELEFNVSSKNDSFTLLKDFSLQIANRLSSSFGEERISSFYKSSHKTISAKYSLLHVFPFVLDLIPEKFLRFEDINTLDNAYLRDALKKTVEQLTLKNELIKKKNLALEKTERKLKRLTDRLQVINEIDRTILKSDSLDDFIYGTLDILQSKMNLENATLVFFDFEKQYYLEHMLDQGKQKVQQKILAKFKGDLSKLKNSEYDLISASNNNEQSMLYYPIVEQGELIASISCKKGDSIFEKEFISTIEELSGGMAISIVNRKLEEELKKRNKDMTDSLYYAQRIQSALIPSFKNFTKLFKDSFVLFRPKDVVSGDFYWAHQTFDNRKIWITADCTGHGVPGAIMSVIGFNILNKVIIEGGIWEADKILNELKENIIKTLRQKGDKHQAKDGMDVSVCIYNPNRGTLQYAGALNSIFVIRKDTEALKFPSNLPIKEHEDNLIELLPNKMPAAYFEGVDVPFTKTTIMVEKGDCIYSFSDGYSDQFGGERDKKFMVKNFRKLLCSIAHLPMADQKELLEEAFLSWKGEREQIDDVCVIGVKIDEGPIF